MSRTIELKLLCALLLLVLPCVATGQKEASAGASAASATAAAPFDVNAAVELYLNKMPPAERARSNAYFEGGYWLLLWDFLSTVVVMWLLLRYRWSVHMRNLAERITRFRPLQAALYWIQFIVIASLLTFPLTM